MRQNLLALSLVSSITLVSGLAFAESAVQAGETLESLSKVKISTSVNGQPGSIDEVLSKGDLKLLNDGSNSTVPVQPPADVEPQPSADQPASIDPARSATEAPAQDLQQNDPIIEN